MRWLDRLTDLLGEVDDNNRSAYEYKEGNKRRSPADRELYWGHQAVIDAEVAEEEGNRRAAQEARENARMTRAFAASLKREGRR